LFSKVCAIHVRLLPRDEPLWQMHVFTGLPGGRVALYFKTHHGLIDGIGFIRVVTGVVTTSPAAGKPRAIWEGMPADPAANAARAAGTVSGDAISLQGILGLARDTGTALGDLARIIYGQSQRGLGRGHGLALPFVATPDVLRTAPSPNRVLAHCTFPLSRARSIARRGEGKVNDVVLAAVDVALNRFLDERGTPPDRPLVADVPVAMTDHGGAGNRITILQVPMGRPGSSAKDRLAEIIVETREMKHQVRAVSASSLALYSILGHTAASTFESLGLEQSPLLANVVISNPAGLDRRVYFNGAPVELALPVAVVAHQQVLNVTVTTYVDQLHVTLMAQREAIPDLRRLADYIVEAVDRLHAEVPAAARPGKPDKKRRQSRTADRRSRPAGAR
jgi:WS/DGAT/MGAT family acyltransferase